MDLTTAISQSSPGPVAINASIGIGYKMFGFKEYISDPGDSIASAYILSIISYFYDAFISNKILQLFLKPLQGGSCCTNFKCRFWIC